MSNKSDTGRAARQRRRGAAEPRAGADSDRRAGRVRSPAPSRYAAARATRVSGSSTSWRSGRWRPSTRQPPSTIARAYRVVNTPESLGQLAGRLKAATHVALRVIPDCPAAMRAGIVGLRVLDRAARRRLRAGSARRPIRRICSETRTIQRCLLPLAAVLDGWDPCWPRTSRSASPATI